MATETVQWSIAQVFSSEMHLFETLSKVETYQVSMDGRIWSFLKTLMSATSHDRGLINPVIIIIIIIIKLH